MDNFFGFLRFTTPAVLTIFFILAASSRNLALLSEINDTTVSLAGILLAATGAVFVFGFIISSIANLLISLLGLRAFGAPRFIGKSYKDFWIDRSKWNEGEYEIWQNLEGEGKKIIANQIVRRWNFAVANINASIGLVIALVVGSALGIQQDFRFAWLTILTIFFAAFSWNAYICWKSVTDINRYNK